MPFVPFTKKSASKDDQAAAPGASPSTPGGFAFGKKPAKRKQRKAAPAQKALMQSGRSMSGGGR